MDELRKVSTGIHGLLEKVICGAKVLWLCGFAVVGLAAGGYLFAINDQGVDFMRLMVEPLSRRSGPSTRIFFILAIIAWSLATWYSTRLLLLRALPGFPLPETASKQLRTWTPRILGTLAPLLVSAGFWRLSSAPTGGAPELSPLVACGLCVILGGVLGVFYWRRRKWFPGLTGHIKADERLIVLPATSVAILVAAIVASFVLLIVFVLFPVGPARVLGAPAIVMLAVTAIVLFGGMVVEYVPLSRGYPGLLLPVLIYAALISAWNDEHDVRTLSGVAVPPVQRRPPLEHFGLWLAHSLAEARARGVAVDGRGYPVFVVAAAGGGIRAAYWTALVLGQAADKIGASAWREHLYAISGVSGGSLGGAVHVIELADPGPEGSYRGRAETMLGEDFLSPVVAFLTYPDLLQRFLPAPIPWLDRARALEASFEDTGAKQLKSNFLADPFLQLWAGGREVELPALLLNSTRVETGERAVVSNLQLTGQFLDTLDLLGTVPTDSSNLTTPLRGFELLPLSAAVHLSARFTYVSPAGRVHSADGKLWGRLVDGGYFENSGAATAAELIHAVCLDRGAACASIEKLGVRPVPVVLLIENDPKAPSICLASKGAVGKPQRWMTEVLSPVDALLNTRDARGRLAESEIMHEVGIAGDRSCREGCVLELSLAGPLGASGDQEGTQAVSDPPLGWSLSEASQREMEARLQAKDLKRAFTCMRELVQRGICTDAPVCPAR